MKIIKAMTIAALVMETTRRLNADAKQAMKKYLIDLVKERNEPSEISL